eukprot:gnl/Spiro4/13665_TR7288_c0_g1_i1.p1 gnl/Spiro4/13665_TR7288_c0_g1~~gnl/Spiro4/13665_TR7288_c0_g1_i1.p1  ORF type:complete len:335 (+),score=76.26 gnl/Spiro4/13665_TR7288_c0_g1_i1:209-1213(+)
MSPSHAFAMFIFLHIVLAQQNSVLVPRGRYLSFNLNGPMSLSYAVFVTGSNAVDVLLMNAADFQAMYVAQSLSNTTTEQRYFLTGSTQNALQLRQSGINIGTGKFNLVLDNTYHGSALPVADVQFTYQIETDRSMSLISILAMVVLFGSLCIFVGSVVAAWYQTVANKDSEYASLHRVEEEKRQAEQHKRQTAETFAALQPVARPGVGDAHRHHNRVAPSSDGAAVGDSPHRSSIKPSSSFPPPPPTSASSSATPSRKPSSAELLGLSEEDEDTISQASPYIVSETAEQRDAIVRVGGSLRRSQVAPACDNTACSPVGSPSHQPPHSDIELSTL